MAIHTTDSEISRLAEMVASLAVQVAALSPPVNNTNIAYPPPPAPPPAPAPAPSAAAAAVAPAPSSPSIPASTSEGSSTSEDMLPGGSTSAHRRWYVVIVGLQVGVFRGWTNTAPLVLGVPGSVYNREPTREAATVAFNAAAALGQVRIID